MTRPTTPSVHAVLPAIAAQKAAMDLLLAEVQALCAMMQGRLPSFAPAAPPRDDRAGLFDNLPV